MITIFITVKDSFRYPGKNTLLAPYTRAWLCQELADIKDPGQVLTCGPLSARPTSLPSTWEHYDTPHGLSQYTLLSQAMQHVQPTQGDLFVLTQLTQPLRCRGLLPRFLDALRHAPLGQPAVTVTPRHSSDEWRVISPSGGWAPAPEHPCHELMVDGQLYGWRSQDELSNIYSPAAPKATVLSGQTWGYVDIDYSDDMPPALSAMAASLLYA